MAKINAQFQTKYVAHIRALTSIFVHPEMCKHLLCKVLTNRLDDWLTDIFTGRLMNWFTDQIWLDN